ncbi:MAG TPA: O-antigen ligase family protein [Anaerolineales bacterium]|nr:O-antigen ligase family protein [Anaerolineales bacterium]
MDIPFLDNLNRLGAAGYILLVFIGFLMVYLTLSNRVNIILPFIVLSAAFVGSSISIIDSLSPVSRWITIFLLLLSGVMQSKMKVSLGGFLFWMYVFFGFVSLFGADAFLWQFQRSVLLIIVTLGISLAYGDKPIETYKSTLIFIAIGATIFSVINFILLPNQLRDPSRFAGFARGAASFAMTLGGLLPFILYGFSQTKSAILKIIFGIGFLAGAITLIFTGQRAGTIAGLVSLVPLLIFVRHSKNFLWSVMLAVAIVVAGQLLLERTSYARLDFLMSRYSFDAGLSNRETIWQLALDEISKNPIGGRGIGAAEQLRSNSFHHTYLEVWYNTGLLGLVFFVAAQIYFFLRTLITMLSIKDPEKVAIMALALGYFMGFLVLCFVESTGAGASNANLILYIYLGVLVSNLELFRSDVEQLSITINSLAKQNA